MQDFVPAFLETVVGEPRVFDLISGKLPKALYFKRLTMACEQPTRVV